MNSFRLLITMLKQYIRKPECIILLLALPILTFLLSNISRTEEQTIRAACYFPGITTTDLSSELPASPGTQPDLRYAPLPEDMAISADTASFLTLAKRLFQYEGLYTFYLCSSEQEVYDAVAANQAECGYIFPDDLYEELLDNNIEELVTTVTSPSTTMLPVINETVYSMIFEELALDALKQYLAEDSAVSEGYGILFDNNDIEEAYNRYLLGDSVFHFEYNGSPDDYHLTVSSALLSPIRGLLAILMLLSAFSGAVSFYKLSENPVFHRMNVRIFSIIVPVLYTMPVMLLCILFGNLNTGFLKEILMLILYGIACILGTLLLTLCIKKRVIFISILPILILACLIFTPVFIDISVLVPALKPLSYVLLPYYYLIQF